MVSTSYKPAPYSEQCKLLVRASKSESCLAEEVNLSANTSSAFGLSVHQNIGIYGGIVAIAILVIIMRVVLCYLVILAASRSIHSKMLTAVLRAPVLFFDTNPVGEFYKLEILL